MLVNTEISNKGKKLFVNVLLEVISDIVIRINGHCVYRGGLEKVCENFSH